MNRPLGLEGSRFIAGCVLGAVGHRRAAACLDVLGSSKILLAGDWV